MVPQKTDVDKLKWYAEIHTLGRENAGLYVFLKKQLKHINTKARKFSQVENITYILG